MGTGQSDATVPTRKPPRIRRYVERDSVATRRRPQQCRGLRGTPGGTLTPNLLIRSQARLTPQSPRQRIALIHGSTRNAAWKTHRTGNAHNPRRAETQAITEVSTLLSPWSCGDSNPRPLVCQSDSSIYKMLHCSSSAHTIRVGAAWASARSLPLQTPPIYT
jgi:hypothetical protein